MSIQNKVIGLIVNADTGVKIIRDGHMIVLHNGDEVLFNDIVRAEGSNVILEKLDGQKVVVDIQSELLLDESFDVRESNELIENKENDSKKDEKEKEVAKDDDVHESLQVGLQGNDGIARTAQEVIAELHLENNESTITNFASVENESQTTLESLTQRIVDTSATAVDDTATAKEDQIVDTRGNVLTNDEAGSRVTSTGDIQGIYGTFHFNADGSFTYALNANAQHLTENQQEKDTTIYTITDVAGNVTTASLTVTVTGTNDAPTMQVSAPQIISEGAPEIHGKLSATDVDSGETLTYSSTASVPGFTLNSDGSYSMDPSNPAYNALKEGEPYHVAIPVIVTDSQGATDKQTLTFIIVGTNDSPLLTTPTLQHTTEDASTIYGQLTSSDVDHGDLAIYGISGAPVAGFVLHPNGSYSFDPSNPAYQHLAEGQPLELKIQVNVMDSHGGIDKGEIVIEMQGTNDVPKLLAHPGLSLHEDDSLFNGKFTAFDLDSTDKLTFTLDAPVNGFVLNSDGSYTFDPSDSSYQHLAEGDHILIPVRVTVSDNHGGQTSQVLEITLNGTNDKPIIAAIPTSHVSEDHTIQGQLVSTDIDDKDQLSYSLPTPVDGLTLNSDGSYTFDAGNNAYQSLQAGQALDLSIPVNVTDTHGGSSQTLMHIHITGTNDIPMVVGIDHAMGSVKDAHNGMLNIDGRLNIIDIDSGESSFQPQLIKGTYGVLSINSQGHWTYTADATQQALRSLHGAQSLPENFQVLTADGTQHNIELHIKGENIPAIIGGVTSGMMMEDVLGQASVQAHMSIMDPNAGEAAFTPMDVDTAHGHFSLKANGDWEFTLNNQNPDVQALAANAMMTEHILVGSVDGTPHMITLNIIGTNDTPTIAGIASGAIIEDDTTSSISGLLVSSDVDTNAQHSWSVIGTHDGRYGSITIDAKSGQWTYTLDNSRDATQQLVEGAPVSESFTVQVTDEHGATAIKTIVITVNGTNDAPVVSSAVTLAAGTEDTTVTINASDLLANATDVDKGESAQLSVHNLQADHGTITDNKDGTFTFTPEKDYNGQVSFTYDVQDPHGAHVATSASMSLAAVADAAVISGQDSGDIHENTAGVDVSPDYAQPGMAQVTNTLLYADGRLTITDADAGENSFKATRAYDYHGQYGQLMMNADGNWHYIVHAGGTSGSAIDQLGAGQSIVDKITVYSKDGTAHDITVTIHGDNDAPYCSATVQLNSGTEDQAMTLTTHQLLANTHDVDANDAGKINIQNLKADHGSIHDNGDGTFTFTPEKDYNGQVHFTYDVSDAHGGVTHTDATTSLQAVNDAATFSGEDRGDVIEDHTQGAGPVAAALRTSGTLHVDDHDAGEDKFIEHRDVSRFHDTTLHGTYGDFQIFDNGGWNYQADNKSPAIQALKEGETKTETFSVSSVDGTTHDIVITLHGTNDAPTVSSAVTLSAGTEDTDYTLHASDLLAHATDIDKDESAQLSIHNLQANHGTITDNHDGTFTFHPDKDYNGQVNFTYDVQDPHGAHVATSASMSLAAVNDEVTVAAMDTAHAADFGATDEDTTKTFTEAQLLQLVGASDADGDMLHVTAATSPHGTFTRDLTSGDWTFTPAANYHGDDVAVTLTVNDGHADTTAHGMLDVSSVTDAAVSTLTVTAEQQVMNFAQGSASGVVNAGTIAAGGAMHGITIDMTILGGQQVAASGGHGATLISYATPSDSNAMYVWNDAPGKDLTFRVGGTEYATGVAMLTDGHDHRYTFTWDGTHGTLDVLIDGQVVKHMDSVGQGATIADGGKFAVGNDQDSFGGGFSTADAFTGQVFNVGIAKTGIDPAQLATAQVGHLLQGSTDLLTVLHAQNGQFVDVTGNYQYTTIGAVQTTTVEVDAAIATPNAGALLKLHLTESPPADPSDHITARAVSGFPAGTVVSDGHGHSITVHTPAESIDITQWATASLTAQLPSTYHGNMNIGVAITTTGPDGTTVTAVDHASVILDPSLPVPDATIAGDDQGTTPDDDTAVSGVLTVTDSDASQAHFTAQSDTAGKYGKFSIGADGHWTYTPDDRADALANGQTGHESFSVQSADGTIHQVDISVTGTNDAPMVSAATQLQGTEDTNLQMHAVDFGFNDVDHLDKMDHVTIKQLLDPAQGHFELNGQPVTANQDIATADIAYLVFKPAPNFNGDVVFKYTVNDGHTDSAEVTGMIQVAPVPGQISIDSIDNSLEVQHVTTGGHPVHGANHPGHSGHWAANAYETTSGDVTIHGSATHVPDGTTVTVHLVDKLNPANTFDITGTVTGGMWSARIDHSQVDKVGTHDWTVIASAVDETGATVQTSTEIIDEGTLKAAVDEGDAQTSLDLLDGADDMQVGNLMYSIDGGKTFTSQIPAGFVLAADGHTLQVDPADPAYDHLAAGVEQKIIVKYEISESVSGNTESITQTAEVKITGTDDAATISVIGTHAVDLEHAASTVPSGMVRATDVDSAAPTVVAMDHSQGSYGGFSVNAAGIYKYEADPDLPASKALADGVVAHDRFTVTFSDGSTKEMLIDVTGTNDAPTVTADTGHVANLGTTDEDTAKTFSEADLLRMVGAHDSDSGDTLHVSAVSIDPQYGSFAKQGSDWVFTPTANFDGTNLPVTVEVTDGTANTAAHASIEINPVADAPTLSVSLGNIPLTTHTDTHVQLVDSVVIDISNIDLKAIMQDAGSYGISRVAIASMDGLDPHMITGIEIDGKPVSGPFTIVSTGDGDGFELDLASVASADSITLTFAQGAPHTMRWEFVPNCWDSDFSTYAYTAMGGFSFGGELSVNREVSSGATTTQVAQVNEDTDIPLHITVGTPDPDEHLSVTVIGLPAGATLSQGTANADGSWTLTPAQLQGLHIIPSTDWAGTINLAVTATSTEGTQVAHTTSDLQITVIPVAETPTVDGMDATGDEDAGAIALDIQIGGHIDASETRSITIEGVQDGAVLSAGTKNSDGSWTLTPDQLHGLTVTPEDQWSGTMALRVTATSTESSGEHASASTNLAVHVNPVLDLSVTTHDIRISPGSSGFALPLDIANLGVDTESMSWIRVHMPQGWKVVDSHGIEIDPPDPSVHLNLVSHSVALDESQLADVRVVPPAGYTGTSTLSFSAELTDGSLMQPINLGFHVTVSDTVPAPAPQADEADSDQIIDTTVSITANEQEDDTENGDHDQSVPPPPAFEMPSEEAGLDLDKASKLLDEQPKPVASGLEDALKSAATLLDDTKANSKEAEVVKAVENQEGKEHVANPDAPDHSSAISGDQPVEEQSAEYVPDMHSVVNDHDVNDGSGIKG